MKICAGIISWQDGDALTNAIESVHAIADEIVVVDGLQDGIDPAGLEPFTPVEQLRALCRDYGIHYVQCCWPSQSAQRQATLQHARAACCDWLLAIDADEQLCNPRMLRPWLEVWRWDAFPIPFYFAPNENRQAQPLPSKCLHVPSWRAYRCQGTVLENQQGVLVQVGSQNGWVDPKRAGMPYLTHRPELRPQARQAIRLSEHETMLEPYPQGVQAWLDPVYAPSLLPADSEIVGSLEQAARLGVPVWYCPGCGRRYGGPGSCTAQHERLGLQPLQVAAA